MTTIEATPITTETARIATEGPPARTVRAGEPQGLTDQATAPLDAVACLDERVRKHALPPAPTEPGRYLEVQGPLEALLIRLDPGVLHIGRGLSADLRLDDASVSRRHAILVIRSAGVKVLNDRSSLGTLVNGRRVAQSDLRDGDLLVLGRVILRYLEVPET